MKPPRLYARWSRRENAVVYGTDLMSQGKAHGAMLAYFFEDVDRPVRSLIAELEARGFDLTTLRFQIRKKEKVTP